MKRMSPTGITLVIAVLAAILVAPHQALAADAQEIERDALAALAELYETTPAARKLGEQANAVLMFPSILKAGLIIGAQGGNGALIVNGKVVDFYQIAAASYGLQAGAQEFSYAMFLMTDAALEYLKTSDGWEVGVGPSIVILDEGAAKSLTTTTGKDDVYAFIFGQKGLMAGIGIQGSKITRIEP